MLKWTQGVVATVGLAAAVSAMAGDVRVIYVADDVGVPVRGMQDGSSWFSAYDSLQDAIDDARGFGGPHEIRVARGRYVPEFAPFVPGEDDPDASGQGGPIPDGVVDHEEPGVAVFTINVSSAPSVNGLELSLDLMHTFAGDLQILLESPAGTEVEVVNRVGAGSPTSFGDGSDYAGMYAFIDGGDDLWAAAMATFNAIPPGSYQCSGNNFDGTFPVHNLDAFDGEAANGTWTLTIRDWAQADVGELLGWTLNFAINEVQPPRGEGQQGAPRDRRFAMYPDIVLRGGYRGPFDDVDTGKFSPDDRDPREFPSVLDGLLEAEEVPARGMSAESVYHVVNASEADETSLLEGFWIVNGNADGEAERGYGAGVWVGGEGHLVMRECIVEDNRGSHGAGLFVAAEASAEISRVQFRNNQSTNLGGAVYSEGASAFANVVLEGNSAFDGAAAYNDGDAIWANALMTGNVASFKGGAMVSTRGDLVVTNSTIAGNQAGTVGGIAALGGSLTLTNSIIWGNSDLFGESFGAQLFIAAPFAATASIVQNAPEEPGDKRGGGAIPGLISADPQFQNEPAGDFRLSFGSAAIDTGDNDAIAMDFADLDGDEDTAEPLPLDLDENPRIAAAIVPSRGITPEAVVDMGAYEFNGGIEERRCLADANDDEVVDFADLEMLLEQWNTPGPESDFDGSGLVDFSDLNELLANWARGCVLPD